MNQGPAQLPLRDIHLPHAPSWWPPAPGWWIVAAILLAIVACAAWWRGRQRRLSRSAMTAARHELARLRSGGEPLSKVRDASSLMRRLAISVFPRRDAAGLTGEAWLHFLDAPMENAPFSRGPGRILINAPYRRSVSEDEVRPLLDLCAGWIDAVEKKTRGGSAP
jgi:hypothetical protein